MSFLVFQSDFGLEDGRCCLSNGRSRPKRRRYLQIPSYQLRNTGFQYLAKLGLSPSTNGTLLAG